MKYPIIYYKAQNLCRYGHIERAKKIIDFDCVNIHLEQGENCGGFFISIPISNKNYRKENPTLASVVIIKKRGLTKFKIIDDWGNVYVVKIANKFWRIIKKATHLATEQNLIK